MIEQTETSEVSERETRGAALLQVTTVDATIPATAFTDPKIPPFVGD